MTEPSNLSWQDVQQRRLPPPGERLTYGPLPLQFGELRMPDGEGPHPVAVLVHGGCWLKDYDYQYFTHLGYALTELGYATWTIEYRRLGDEGGGWPHTFTDVALATDHLRRVALSYPLDLQKVVTIGHSAGGQLALWLAARHKLPQGSELHSANPLPIKAVIGLAPITDLDTYRVGPRDSCNASVERLLGGSPAKYPQRYLHASPMALLPLGVPQWLIQGGRDPIVPIESVQHYASSARVRGDRVKLLKQIHAGHFEPAMPELKTWEDLKLALSEALQD